MFCTNCGKEIIDTARFCNYCGSRVIRLDPTTSPAPSPSPAQTAEQVITTPAEPSYNAPTPEQNSGKDAQTEASYTALLHLYDALNNDNSANIPTQSPDMPSEEQNTFAPESEPVPQQSTANTEPPPVFDQKIDPYPMPGAIPKSGGSVSEEYSAPMSYPPYDTIIEPVPSAPEKRERKYTLGHILLFLASTAVMAITAGIFAGLYFSVV